MRDEALRFLSFLADSHTTWYEVLATKPHHCFHETLLTPGGIVSSALCSVAVVCIPPCICIHSTLTVVTIRVRACPLLPHCRLLALGWCCYRACRCGCFSLLLCFVSGSPSEVPCGNPANHLHPPPLREVLSSSVHRKLDTPRLTEDQD